MAAISLRAKLVLAYTACALAAFFLVFAGGSYYVNRLQQGNVREAVRLAQDQARQLAREVLEVLDQESGGQLGDPGVARRLRPMTDVILRVNRNVVWAAVVDASGNRIIERTSGSASEEQRFEVKPAGVGPYEAKLPTGAGDVEVTMAPRTPTLREFKEPISRDGRHVGDIVLRVTETPAYERILTTSRQISLVLAAECAALLLLLLGVFWILSRLFSRQMRLERRNAELDRMAYVGTLAAGLAHEIRNPLGAMKLHVENISDEIADQKEGWREAAADAARRVEREVGQLNSTLSRFLEFAVPSKSDFTVFPLRAAVADLLEWRAEEIRRADITCEFESAADDQTLVRGDRRQLTQTIGHVLTNAVDAVAGGVKRVVRTQIRRNGPGVVLTVSDTGPGFSPETAGQAFDVFFTTKMGGSGLGLAVARKVIEAHGGTIAIANNPETLGAIVTITLPFARSESE